MRYEINLLIDDDEIDGIVDQLKNITILLEQGYTSGFYPNWDLVDNGAKKVEEEKEHEHDYDEKGICSCGEIHEPDDFSGGSLGNDDR